MNFQLRRKKLLEKINEGTIILFSGREIHFSADEAYPFAVNRNFYYLTGIKQKDTYLILNKQKEKLFILPNDEKLARWVGYNLFVNEAKDISMCDDVETFENDQYISIAVSNNLGALCDAKSLYEDGEYYIYSKESQTMLTKEEILKAFSLTESDILSKINKYYKKDTLADLDYNIFISVTGELKITFLGDDGRYYITLQELYKESQDDQKNQSSGLTDIDFE